MTENPRDIFDWLNLIFQGLVAIGTLLLGALAIFGKRIKNYLFSPNINLSYSSSEPNLELIAENSDEASDSSTEYQEIRIKFVNDGKITARNCKVLTDQVFERRAGSEDLYKSRAFIPTEFYWTNEDKNLDLFPSVPSYLSVARIAEKISYSTSEEELEDENQDEYSLMLLIEGTDGNFVELGKGKYVFPLIVYSNEHKSIKENYIEIYWNGEDSTDISDDVFHVELLSGSEFSKKYGDIE